jgi:hypothetical protein
MGKRAKFKNLLYGWFLTYCAFLRKKQNETQKNLGWIFSKGA